MKSHRTTERMDSTLAKGLAALEWLVRQRRPCRVSELAEALGIARSNAHRTLQTLVECGWAVQDEATSAYRPPDKPPRPWLRCSSSTPTK